MNFIHNILCINAVKIRLLIKAIKNTIIFQNVLLLKKMRNKDIKMIRDIPYYRLKFDYERAYGFMLLREQHGFTFSYIARDYDISSERVMQMYHRVKNKQIQLYINRIAFVLGHNDKSQIQKEFDEAYKCYRSRAYACAYLEREYSDILTEYRQGEPGMPELFIKSIPPFRPKLSKKTFERIIEMKDKENASFSEIAKELNISPKKAKCTYESYYHRKTLELLKSLDATTKSEKEKKDIWEYCFNNNYSAKKRYDRLLKIAVLSR